MLQDSFVYSGKEELNNMELMTRYNAGIVGIIKRYLKDDKKILDFGAGIGTLASFFPKKNIICLEIDEDQKKELERKHFQTVKHIAEIEDESMSFVYSSNVLEHIEDDYQAVRDIYSKVTPGGRIVFYVPAFPILYSSMDKRVGHFRRYTKKRLKDVFEKAGFKIETVFYSDSLGFFTTLLFKFFGPKNGSASQKNLLLYDRFIYPISSFCDIFLNSFFGKNIVIVGRKT